MSSIHRIETGSAKAGFTILEVLIALFILSLAVVASFSLLTTADQAAAIGKTSACSSILASNEAERIKCAVIQGDRINDTTYSDSIDGQFYDLKRTVLGSDNIGLNDTGLQVVEITLTKNAGEKVIGTYRVLTPVPEP